MDLTKILKFRNDRETAEFLGVSIPTIGNYRRGMIPHYKTILEFQKRTNGKINYHTFFGKNKLKTNI